MALDLTTRHSATVAVATDADNVLAVSPQRVYQFADVSANAVYGSTDGSAVDPDDSEAAGKFKLLAQGHPMGGAGRFFLRNDGDGCLASCPWPEGPHVRACSRIYHIDDSCYCYQSIDLPTP